MDSGIGADGEHDAAAQDRACSLWEVRTIVPPTTREVTVAEQGGTAANTWIFDALKLDDGWEPFGGRFDRAPTIALRRCIE
jgi:hypothetical protein